MTSSLEVDEGCWACRVRVRNGPRREERDYQLTMEQRCGGRFDGYWYTRTLLAEGCSASNLYGVI